MSRKQEEKKQEFALRILGALSGVDEELLERSEKKASKTGTKEDSDKAAMFHSKAVVYKFMQRHGKALAACLCLCVLGTAFWGMRQLAEVPFAGTGNSLKSADKASTTGMPGNYESAMENPAEAAAPESALEKAADGAAPEAAMEEAAGGAVSEAVRNEAEALFGESSDAQGATEPEWIAMKLLMKTEAIKNNKSDQGMDAVEDLNENKQMEETEAAVIEQEDGEITDFEEISWEEAGRLAGLGMYVPDSLPDGYEPVFVRYYNAEEGRGRLTLLCSSGEKKLWLNITETDWTADMFTGLETPVLSEKENWKSKLPKPDGDGGMQFGLLLEDGVLAEYQGYLTEKEIFELFDSIQ